MSLIYARVQTNRETLQKYMSDFRVAHETVEKLISPRPPAGCVVSQQRCYYALVVLNEGSKLHAISKKFSMYSVLSNDDFSDMVSEIKHSWKINW